MTLEMKRTLGEALDGSIEATAAPTVPMVVVVDAPDGAGEPQVCVLTGADWDGELLILNVRESHDPTEWGIA